MRGVRSPSHVPDSDRPEQEGGTLAGHASLPPAARTSHPWAGQPPRKPSARCRSTGTHLKVAPNQLEAATRLTGFRTPPPWKAYEPLSRRTPATSTQPLTIRLIPAAVRLSGGSLGSKSPCGATGLARVQPRLARSFKPWPGRHPRATAPSPKVLNLALSTR